jgi:hypothetical protein
MDEARSEQVLTVLDDASSAGTLLDISCTLAQLTHRDLQLVYVESVNALAAAALSATQVLAQATARWAPLTASDVERAWLAHARRLRALAEQASTQRAVSWSLRVTRGNLQDTAHALQPQADLLLVGGEPGPLAPAVGRAPRRLVLAFDDGSAAGQQAVAIARQLSGALGARLQVQPIGTPPSSGVVMAGADLVVTPGLWPSPIALAGAPRRPTLLVAAARVRRA